MTDEPLEVCRNCLDFAGGDQPQKDLIASRESCGKCRICKWYDEWFGVCFNGDSPYCADYPPYPENGCKEWEEKDYDRIQERGRTD